MNNLHWGQRSCINTSQKVSLPQKSASKNNRRDRAQVEHGAPSCAHKNSLCALDSLTGHWSISRRTLSQVPGTETMYNQWQIKFNASVMWGLLLSLFSNNENEARYRRCQRQTVCASPPSHMLKPNHQEADVRKARTLGKAVREDSTLLSQVGQMFLNKRPGRAYFLLWACKDNVFNDVSPRGGRNSSAIKSMHCLQRTWVPFPGSTSGGYTTYPSSSRGSNTLLVCEGICPCVYISTDRYTACTY